MGKDGKKKKELGDKEIRRAFLERNKDFFKKNIFANEFGINSTNVVDFASFDFDRNIFYGFEIKSPKDNLTRLYKQLTAYSTFFNIVYLIVHDKHLDEAMEMINKYDHFRKIGVIRLDDSLNFEEIKQASMYKPFFDLFIRNLEMEDVRNLCEANGIPTIGYNKKQLTMRLKTIISVQQMYDGIRHKLEKYHVKKCPNCGSNLFYNRREGSDTMSVCFECGWECINEATGKKFFS